jgi:hypothetical protein
LLLEANMIRVLFVAMTFFSISAIAQTGPCSAGIQDPPIFALAMGSPVRLTFSDTIHHAGLTAPSVTIAANEIAVLQTYVEGGPGTPPPLYPPASCNSQSVSLGDLTSGPYTVTWKYQTTSNVSVETFSFAFTVPEASPCVAGMSIRPQSPLAGQPVSIIYAATFRGFLQTPSVAIDGNLITIDQPAVIADPAFPGQVPCARGVVQIGALQAGYYPVSVRSNSGAPMSDAFTVGPVVVGPVVRGRAVRGH